MLADVRAAVYDIVSTADILPVWDVIPDDPNEVPCAVIGRPLAAQTTTAVVFDMVLEIIVVGRRQQAGSSEQELTVLTDQLWVLFNGTRATRHGGYGLAVRSIFPRIESIAGLEFPAYVLSVESSIATC